MAIVSVGIDLAKNVFAVHGVDESGKPALVRPNVPRAKLLELIASLPPCHIGMEACSGAHHWAREFQAFGHTVRLMAPKFVIPYRLSGKRGKNDAADAAAICEAVSRPNMRFVPVKSTEQQGQLLVHRARQALGTLCLFRWVRYCFHIDPSQRYTMRSMLDFSSWSTILTTLLSLVVMSLVLVGIRLVFMQTFQRRRERENRQINERLKVLIAAYKTMGGSFTGVLTVDPAHLRELRRDTDQDGDGEFDTLASASERRRRIRDAVEAALSDIILLGTEEQLRLAAHAAHEMVEGRNVEVAALVVSLRDFIRQALDLTPVPADTTVPNQGPLRVGAGGASARRGGGAEARGGRGGGGGGGAGGGGAGLGIGMGAGAGGGAAVADDRQSSDTT